MTVLGIDTSSSWCGAAVVRDGEPGACRMSDIPRVHAERLLGVIDDCLREAGIGPDGIDGVAVSSGPGSFTGLRVGYSTAKGICVASGCAFLPVPTFEAWSHAAARHMTATGDRIFLVLLAAGKEEVYAGSFRSSRTGVEVLNPVRVFNPGEILRFASELGEYTAVGERREEILRFLPDTRDENIFTLSAGHGSPAVEVALLGSWELRAGRTSDVVNAEPEYFKEFSYQLPSRKGA